MLLLLQLRFHLLPARRTVFVRLEILPGDPPVVLPMQTDGSDAIAGNLAEHCEDGALSSWHSCRTLLSKRYERKA